MAQQPTQAPTAQPQMIYNQQQQNAAGAFQQLSGQNQEAILMMQQRQAMLNQRGAADQGPREPRQRMPSIFVGDLPEDYYQLDLFKHVKGMGFNVKTAIIGVDKKSKRQNRFGFLHFYTEEEAARCAGELNNTKIGNSFVRCNVQQNEKLEPKANVMVKSVDANVTQQQFSAAFGAYGTIRSCKLAVYPDGKSREFGYIQFETEEMANAAIAQSGVLEFNGKKVEIVLHCRREERAEQERNFLNLFVQGLPEGTDDDKLREMFAEHGEIQSTHVQKGTDSETLTNKGFVSFKQPESAKAALDAMHQKQMPDGSYLLVSRHISRRENEVSTQGTIESSMRKTYESNLFVKNIPSEVTEEELQRHFGQIGEIISIKLRQGKHYNPEAAYQQYFVLYKDIEHAKRAIQAYDQSTPFGGRPLSVQFWMPTQELQQQREQRSFNEVQQYFLRNMFPNPQGQMGNQQYGQRNGQYSGYQGQNRNNNYGPRDGRQGGRQFNGGRGGNRNNMRQANSRDTYRPAANQATGEQMPPEMMQQQMNQSQGAKVDVQRLMAMDPTERRQEIGNNIYPSIQQMYGDAAGKITGMLLDNEKVVDPVQLVSDLSYLHQKASEAAALLQQTQQQQQPPQQ